MKRLNRILSILLVVALLIPGFVFAENPGNRNLNEQEIALLQRVADNFRANSEEKLDLENLEEFFKPEDEVRIIVELESDPTIVYATESNISYQEMSINSIKSLERKIEAEQQSVKNSILSSKVDMEFINSFKTSFNGFSGKVKFEDIKLIESLPSVKNVYIANEYERPDTKPDMDTSNDMVGSGDAWELGYKGEGTVIAIIDTGIDPSHRDMVLSEETNPRLTSSMIEEKDLLGRYFTEKVPYGYNYYDLNDEIRDLGPDASMHGMHVAGTAGANGDRENGGVKGVAPEAQLLAMKVFSNDPIYATTFSDIYMVAIDEAIRLGADVLNMSLGSTASFYIPNSAEDVAITNATNNGIVCSVSAGNSGSMTYGWAATNVGYPWKQNPDIGVVGAPGLNKDTIQVASIENTHQKVNYITYEKDGVEKKTPMAVAGNLDPASILPGNQVYVDGGSGHPSELTNVRGKIALIVRGGLTPNFTDKIQNAQDAGAIGVIVRNHVTGGEALVNMATPPVQTIPAVFIGYQGGLDLMGLGQKVLKFSENVMTVPNPNANLMSDFTSWGVTPSFDLKPEITAPGGQIYSTLNNNKYGMMSGTSMAAPHVAGGSALVMEYIKEHEVYGNLSLSEQTRLAKVLLMNTANVVFDEDEIEYSPRRQGSGLMNLYGAVSTPVRVVNATTNEAKVELKDFENTEFTMTFKAINVTDTEATYNVDVAVLKDYIYPYGGAQLNLLASDYISGADIDAPETVTVPANGEIEFDVVINIGTDRTIYRNMFVEGFVYLEDPNDNNPALSVPYVGFYGDWGEPKILDGMRFIDPAGASYFNRAGMLYWDINEDGYFYTSPRIYMSTGTMEGYFFGTGNIMPYLSFMRNAEKVKYSILDSEGNNLRTILTQDYVRKNYINGGTRQPVGMILAAEWDGTINGRYLPDGNYFYEIAAKVHYDGAQFQSKKIPITIDTVAPVVQNFNLNSETKKLTWDVVEANGMEGFLVTINGIDLEGMIPGVAGKTSYELDLTDYLGELKVQIVAVDYAMNMSLAETNVILDNSNSYIYILSPGLLNVYDESEVLFEGYVANFAALDKVIINETEEADVEFVENAVVRHPDDNSIIYTGPAYKFTKVISLEDGYREVRVEATSKTGARSSLVRRFFVDTTPAELDIVINSINREAQTAELGITMRDNMGYLKLLLGDSQIFEYDHPLVVMGPTEKTFTYTVNLPKEDNNFIFTLYDLANHVTIEEIEVSRKVIINLEPANNVRIEPGETIEISFNAPVGGRGYYQVVLPYDISGKGYGTLMTEVSPGFYTAIWTADSRLVAGGLMVKVTYLDANGNEFIEIANGRLYVGLPMEELPSNSVIINGEAFDIRLLNTDASIQEKYNNWNGEVYIKLNANTIVNSNGELVDLNALPEVIEYKDALGRIMIYRKNTGKNIYE